jgi:hypothetical protein
MQSENEQKARRMLTEIVNNEIPAAEYLAHLITASPDSIPALTDAECAAIAVNYPLSFAVIRRSFPSA